MALYQKKMVYIFCNVRIICLERWNKRMRQALDYVKNWCVIIHNLIKNDIKARYSGSLLGMIWAYVQPMVTICVFWYVFQLGFKNPPVENIEYILWFIAGYIPWTLFNDAVSTSTNVFYEYSYLVKKIKFHKWLLPIVKVLSSFYIHIHFIIFIYCMFLLYGYEFNIAWISLFYYSFIIVVLSTGFAYLCATLSVFLKDFSQIIGIVLQVGFWLSPVFWTENAMNTYVLRFLRRNPMYYVISGYRLAMTQGVGFWQNGDLHVWCWGVTTVVFCLGVFTYYRLRKHFADLL